MGITAANRAAEAPGGIVLDLGALASTMILDAISESLEDPRARGAFMYQHVRRAVLPQIRQLFLHDGPDNRVATKLANVSNKAAM